MKKPSCFSLADALHRENSYVLKLSKLDDLIDFIQQNKFDSSVQQCKNLLLFGGKGINRIDLIFEDPDAPENLKLQCIKLLALLAETYKNPSNFYKWIFSRIKAEKDDDLVNYFLLTFKEVLKVPINNESIQDQVFADFLEFLNSTRSSKHLIVLLGILENFKLNYPHRFQYYFPKIIDILVGFCIDPEVPSNVLEILLTSLTNNWPFWMANIDHGIELISNLCYDLEQDYGICVEPGKPKTVVVDLNDVDVLTSLILKTCIAVTKGLIMASFPNINSQTSYSITSNEALQRRFKVALEWLLRVASTIGLQLQDNNLNTIVFNIIGVGFQTCHSSDDYIAQLGLEIVNNYKIKLKDCKAIDIDNWIYNVSNLYSSSGLHQIKPPTEIIELFLDPSKKGFILDAYLPLILDKPLYLDRLQFACVTMASFHIPGISDSFLKLADDCSQWFFYLGANTSKKPKCAAILGSSSLSKYKKLFTFLMDLVTNLSCMPLFTVYPGAKVFRAFYKFIVTSSTSSFVSLPWWDEWEHSILSNLKRISKYNKFFLPRILIPPTDTSFENYDIVQIQFKIISLLSQPNHYGQNIFGLEWIREIVEFISDKNILNTDVEDSAVLNLVEKSLREFLVGTDAEEDWTIRKDIGTIWVSYLQYFSENRRGINDSAKVISLIHRRTHDIDERVSEEFFKALCSLDAFDTLINLENLQNYDSSTFKKAIMRSDYLGAFNANHFLIVADYLGMTASIANLEDFAIPLTVGLKVQLASWLPDIYLSCQADKRVLAGPIQVSSNLEVMTYWVLWEMSQFIITSRLKTPFGSPVQTLDNLEITLDGYLSATTVIDKPDKVEFMKRLAAFLLFLDILECQILSAATGCSSVISNPPKSSILFFHGNISVCNDWFRRVRFKIMRAAGQVENDGLILRHGYSGLSELFDQLKNDEINVEGLRGKTNFYFISVHDALKRQRNHIGLIGFREFWEASTKNQDVIKDYDLHLDFLESGSLLCNGRIESGIRKILPLMNNGGLLASEIHESILKGYASLHDWDSVKKYACADLKLKENYLHKLSFWEHGKISSKESLSLGSSISSNVNELIFEDLQTVFSSEAGTPFQRWTEVKSQLCINSIDAESRLMEKVILYQSFYGKAKEANFGNGIKLRKANPKDRITRKMLKERDIQYWSQIYHINKVVEKSKKARDPDLNEIGGLLVDLSRKTGNLLFARRLIDNGEAGLTASAKMRIRFKEARILHTEGKVKEACIALLDCLSSAKTSMADLIDAEILAKSCSLLVKWNQLDLNDLHIQAKIERAIAKSIDKELLKQSNEVVEELFLKRAMEIAPQLPKSWSHFASFNYNIGRSLLEDLLPEGQPRILKAELHQVAGLLKEDNRAMAAYLADLLEQLGESHKDPELSEINWREALDQQDISSLESIQVQIKQAIFAQFEATSAAYFTFLKTLNGRKDGMVAEEVTATLRLLRIFVRYGVALESSFIESFSSSPVEPWRNVTPQLFARLMHPELVVREEISSLIMRIGESYPHLVIYSIFDDSSDHFNSHTFSIEAHKNIRESLKRSKPKLTAETLVWIKELQRVTIVWEETWVIGLEKLKGELNARHAKLQKDAKRINTNASLSNAEKEEIIESTTSNLFKPVLYQFEKLCQETIFKSPETPHEKEFIQKYGDLIAKAHQELISENSFLNINKLFATCQLLLSDLKNYVTHRPTFSLESVSPFLAEFNCSGIQIPGIHDEIVFVGHFDDQVQVLPTKTRPKRISITSQDGQIFPFLLKGHEDLHLDSRIQQLLHVTNHLLGSGSKLDLNARTFAVIPFGRKFGMIQWLQDVTGIFSLYRKWQNWDHTAMSLQKRATTLQPLRPNEQFVSKIKNLMQSGRLPASTPRKAIPNSILLEVFKELQNDTPSNIISNELWASSRSSTAFHRKTSTFARSLAVMSMFGYIIGLGDRHLDNILIDLSKGEVIHIDYNVCFEKGLKLTIPETVPFRFTQNFVHGCGIFGGFRVACEEVMGVLRRNREHLLTLLETFVYDPLLDWTSDLSTTMLQINVEIGKFTSRILESRSVIQDFVEELGVYCETTLYECSRLSEIVDGGGFAVKEMAALAIRDSTHSCEVMVQKLTRLVQESKKLLNPLLKIILTIIKLSSGTSFTSSSEYISLKSIFNEWEATLKYSEGMQENSKKFQNSLDFESLQGLEKSLLLLSTSLKSIFSNLMSSLELEPLSELVSEEDKKDVEQIDGNQDKLRNNREQSKNKTAIAVILRVKQKLEGKDNPLRSRLDIKEHVTQLINDATHPEKLCKMYEGWMSWI